MCERVHFAKWIISLLVAKFRFCHSIALSFSFSFSVRCFAIWHRFHRMLYLLANDAQIRAVLTRLRLSVRPSLFTSKSIRISLVPCSKTYEQLYFNLYFSLIFWCYCCLPPTPPLPRTPFNGSLPFSLEQPHTTLYYAAFRVLQTYYSMQKQPKAITKKLEKTFSAHLYSNLKQTSAWQKHTYYTYVRPFINISNFNQINFSINFSFTFPCSFGFVTSLSLRMDVCAVHSVLTNFLVRCVYVYTRDVCRSVFIYSICVWRHIWKF